MPERPTLLLVHGAWHGSWSWTPLQLELRRRGWDVRTIDLPSVHASDPSAVRLADDADAIAAAVDEIGGEVALVAHSYGGVPATEAAKSDSVVHIVYVAAFVLDVGESLLSSIGGVAPHWWVVDASTVSVEMSDFVASHFYGDVDEETAASAVARLKPQSRSVFEEPITWAAWRHKPSTYVVTELEPIARVRAQEAMAARAGSRVVRMSTSHSPFMSRPIELADHIEMTLTASTLDQDQEV